MKLKIIVHLINISLIAKFIDKDLKMKLVHGLVFSTIDFCYSLYFGLPNDILNGLRMLINSAARIFVGFKRFSRERFTPIRIYLHILPIKARIKYKICLLTYKAIHCREPLYLNELLEIMEQSTINLRSDHDTWKVVEHRVPSPGFTNRCFKYCAPHLYNTLPKNVETFKKRLKTYILGETFDYKSKKNRGCFVT